uniref:Uncharacterized protein n=1 Tax=Oryza punctata TaxID=4537 RepID=A0A0E0LTB2_ORYPU
MTSLFQKKYLAVFTSLFSFFIRIIKYKTRSQELKCRHTLKLLELLEIQELRGRERKTMIHLILLTGGMYEDQKHHICKGLLQNSKLDMQLFRMVQRRKKTLQWKHAKTMTLVMLKVGFKMNPKAHKMWQQLKLGVIQLKHQVLSQRDHLGKNPGNQQNVQKGHMERCQIVLPIPGQQHQSLMKVTRN